MTPSLLKSKKFQIVALIILTATVILISLLTDFPEGDTQGSLRNKQLGPSTQTQSQIAPIQNRAGNFNGQMPPQGPGNSGNINNVAPIAPNATPLPTGLESPEGSY